MEERILLCLCKMGGREMDFIHEAFADNWVVPLGPNVNGFEKDLEEFLLRKSNLHECLDSQLKISRNKSLLENKRIVALSSGTAAIHLGLIEAGVKAGDEVIVQSFTFSASANPVVYLGATPVFVDSEKETWNLDPALLEKAIKDRISKTGRKPAAIVPVYLYGMPARIEEILEIASRYEIPVVEDAAEAFGSRYKGQYCGTFGNFGALSFNGNKMITTSGGGALITPDEEAWKDVMKYATQSREPAPWYQHERIGYNYRMSNICAGIGRGQMLVAEEYLSHHKYVQSRYKKIFSDIESISLHENPGPDFDSNFWLCAVTFSKDIRVKGDDGCGTPEAMRRRLENLNIETRHLWKPMHMQPFFKDAPAYLNGVSEHIFRSGLCLPAGPWVGDKEIERIAKGILDSLD